MSILQNLLLVLVALMGIPAGFIIANAAKEELKPGKKWFLLIAAACLAGIVGSLIFSEENLALFATSFGFVFFVAVISLIKAR